MNTHTHTHPHAHAPTHTRISTRTSDSMLSLAAYFFVHFGNIVGVLCWVS